MSLAVHALTPVLVVRDARGLGLREVNYCRRAPADPLQPRIQGSQYDAAGRLRACRDPRLWALHEQDAATPANLGQAHSLSGRVVWRESVDSGTVCSLFGEAGQVVRAEDGKGVCREFDYDAMLRPTALHEQANGQPRACRERLGYADAAPEHAAQNACGRLLRHDDTAGTRELRGYALNGEVRSEVRRFSRDAQLPDWPVPIAERELLLESDTAAVLYCHGPLGEVLEQTDASDNRQSLGLTLCGELREVRVQLKGGSQHVLLVAARYNAFGQMEEEILGNGVRLQRLYREEDGRLSQLAARRRNGDLLQELRYEYDPAGNVLSIEDRAMPVRHFANQQVEPRCEYGYDSLYQLIEAKGWEAGAASKGPGSLLDPGAVSNYRQSYEYDAGGNLLHLVHAGAQAHGRTLVAARHSNRCLPANEDFERGFDANGNLLCLQPGQALSWNTRNELREVRPVIRAGGSDDWERYLYDGAGRRVRKLGRAQAAKRTHSREVRYLSGLERHDNGSERLEVITVQAGTCSVRILHWLQGRPAGVAQDQVRHALGDHLGSVCLELDGEAALLGREVFHPFGSTAWWAGRNEVEAGYKTVRYSGKERDASGLYYYGARYYRADWQRWLNPDPLGEVEGLNLFRFVLNTPIGWVDIEGYSGFPFQAIESSEVVALARAGNYLGAQAAARRKPSRDIRVINNWILSQVPSIDFQSMTLFDNRLNNSLYKASSKVEGIDFIVKKMHSPERAQREELAYQISEALGFHVVPPAKARAKSLVQQMVPNIKDSRRSERTPSARDRLFYFLINEFDDNSGNQLWDDSGGVQLIDHEAAFSTRKNAVYNLSTIDLTSAFDPSSWVRFKAIDDLEWKSILGGDTPKISKVEAKAFIARIHDTKKAVQKGIDKGVMGFSMKQGASQAIRSTTSASLAWRNGLTSPSRGW